MSDADRKRLGARLKEAREYLGLSQEEVARKLGIPRAAVSLIESGQRKIDALELKKLASVYQRNVADLTGDAAPPPANTRFDLLKRAVAELSIEDQSEVLNFAEFLRSRSRREE